MNKMFSIPTVIALSIFLSGFASPLLTESTIVDKDIKNQQDQRFSERNRLINTQNQLLKYIDYLKPELNLLKAIDTTIIRNIDITFDDKPDIISLHITGKSIMDSLTWKLKIQSEEQTIYRYEDNFGKWDTFFHYGGSTRLPFFVDEKMPNLEGFLQKKRSFYFKELAEMVIKEIVIEKDSFIFDEKNIGAGIYYFFRKQLPEKGMTDNIEIDKIIESTIKRLQEGTYSLNIPYSTKDFTFPQIFVPEVNSFLIFLGW